jgi:hypothetical protein
LVLETTSYLVVLSCMKTYLMKRFYVDDNYVFNKEQEIKDRCYVFCFILCVVENSVKRELDNGMRLQEVSKIPR